MRGWRKRDFECSPLVDMRRPVGTADGEDIAAFSIVRLAPDEMPEGRIQALTHRTEHAVWQPRWLAHPNGATGLIDVVIAEADVAEAAGRFGRFLGRRAEFDRFGQGITLDRGRVQLVSPPMLERLFPGLEIPALPFICGYGVAVRSLDATAACLAAGGISFRPARRLHHRAVPGAARHRMLGVRRARRRPAVAKLNPFAQAHQGWGSHFLQNNPMQSRFSPQTRLIPV